MTRTRVLGLAALVVLAGLVVALAVFQPQKLFLDETVDEALPPAVQAPATTAAGAAATTRAPAGPVRLGGGSFRSLAHPGSGTALLLRQGDGSHLVRLEDLNVENGPDLHVYLAEASAGSDAASFGRDFLDLGRLKGNRGNQNYQLPRDADPSRYRSVVVWCKRFSVGFAVAPLRP
jgi:Electron transfer DM13